MINKRYYFFLGIVFLFNFASANALGCCFDPSSGLCSLGVPRNTCQTIWSSGMNCNSLAECKLGCCILGMGTAYTTERTCQIEARSRGFQMQWQSGISQDQCSAKAGGTEMGACVYERRYENECRFIERKSCSGTFYLGRLCSEPALNTTCRRTNRTKCFEDDGVYYTDSCGNRDVLKNQCNFSAGTTCQRKSSTESYCRDLNCVLSDGSRRRNGESWCIGLGGDLLNIDVRNVEFKKTVGKPEGFDDAVGSRFFKQVCIDGEVITEPCADYRNEVCIPIDGGAKCIANPWEECLAANVLNEQTGLNEIEDCNKEWCYVTRLDDCVSFACTPGSARCQESRRTEPICGEERVRWRDTANLHGWSIGSVNEVSSDLMKELKIPLCVPKIKGGETLSRGSSFSEDGTCSLGNYGPINSWLDHDISERKWRIKTSETHNTLVEQPKRWGNAGLISLNSFNWNFPDNGGIDLCSKSKNPLRLDENNNLNVFCQRRDQYEQVISTIRRRINRGNIPDPVLLTKLNHRVIGIGDCAGSLNWAGVGGTEKNFHQFLAKRGTPERSDHVLLTLSFEARPWRAPSSGNCNLCGEDKLPCSEYRCNALGRNCEYKEPRGIDSGVCVSSNDNSPPGISHNQSPINPIPPYESVLITLRTTEDAYCRFGLNSGSRTIEDLKFGTNQVFGREHSFRLSLPGQEELDEDIEEHPLLTRDGKYQLFVRCEDAAGNYNVNPYIINLEVMDTPDRVPAQIIEFVPRTNSFIRFNTTSKRIRFRLNEPAECRWSLNDSSYENMGNRSLEINLEEEINLSTNQFSCDSVPSISGSIEGYWCTGILTNITKEIGRSTKFFIRCKDQPSLEGREDNLYRRNSNERSFEYILRPSVPLEITEVHPPQGDLIVGSSVGNITYSVRTRGGAENGRAICRWRLKAGQITTLWQQFNRTNSSNHETLLTGLESAEYSIEVFCEDSALNRVNITSRLNILMDTTPPILTRIYNNRGNINIVLNEPARCKFVRGLDCTRVLTNGTSMSSSGGRTEFSTNLVKAIHYSIRCEDDFGNSRCFENIIFY